MLHLRVHKIEQTRREGPIIPDTQTANHDVECPLPSRAQDKSERGIFRGEKAPSIAQRALLYTFEVGESRLEPL